MKDLINKNPSLNAVIVDDNVDHFERIKFILGEFSESVLLLNDFLTRKPFDSAKELIQKLKPDILIIDYDLNEGSQKTGLELYKEVMDRDYKCFVIFTSLLSEAVDSQSLFDNAKFIKKNIDNIIDKKTFKLVLDLAFKYLTKTMTVKLSYYRNGESGGGKENKTSKLFLCERIIKITGRGKEYYFTYKADKEVKRYKGGISTMGKMKEYIMDLGYPFFKVTNGNPITIENILHK